MTACKIIATYIGPRPVRLKKARQRRGIRLQNLATSELVMELLQDMWNLELSIDPHLPLDTYLVCNGGYPAEHKGFFEEIDGAPTPGGTMHVLVRENVGLSFGAYAFAFQRLHHQYGHWLFTEDDVIQVKSGYLPVYLDLLQGGKIGFVATVGLAGYHDELHAHGGCGFTSGEILDRVALQFGGILPHARVEPVMERGRRSGNPVFNHGPFCKDGEVPLTNSIQKMGYELVLDGTYTAAYHAWKYGEP